MSFRFVSFATVYCAGMASMREEEAVVAIASLFLPLNPA